MKVLIDADVIAKSEGGVRLRLHTGFGNPEVLIDAARIELRDDAPDPTDDVATVSALASPPSPAPVERKPYRVELNTTDGWVVWSQGPFASEAEANAAAKENGLRVSTYRVESKPKEGALIQVRKLEDPSQ